MTTSALFIHSSFRTGGTAFAAALKANPTNLLFYDPLNAALSSAETAQNFKSDIWISNHPTNFTYFEHYLPLFEQGKMDQFPDLFKFKFRNSSIQFKAQLTQYLRMLSEFAYKQGKFPVFKVEQLKGHVNLLRENFPEALHVGLVRNPNDQFQSWIEQLALGNSFFFDNALSLINADPEFFEPMPGLSKSNPRDIFENFHSRLITLRSELDFTHNIYEESFEDLFKKYPRVFIKISLFLLRKNSKKLHKEFRLSKSL